MIVEIQPRRRFPQCQGRTPDRWYARAHRCPFDAKMTMPDGKKLCKTHAKQWWSRH